jgi:hypothetical protein
MWDLYDFLCERVTRQTVQVTDFRNMASFAWWN